MSVNDKIVLLSIVVGVLVLIVILLSMRVYKLQSIIDASDKQTRHIPLHEPAMTYGDCVELDQME